MVATSALGRLTAAVLLAALCGPVGYWVILDASRDAPPTASAFVRSLHASAFLASPTADGRGGYRTAVDQVGRIVAISDSSITAAGSDGGTKTYLVTPLTVAVTHSPAHNGGMGSQFTIGAIVSVVGTVEDGTAVATVIVDHALANGNGPPMDG